MRDDVTPTSGTTPETAAARSGSAISRFEAHPKRTLLLIWCVLLLLVELGLQIGTRVFREELINGAFEQVRGVVPDGWTPVNASMRVIPDDSGGYALRVTQLEADVGYVHSLTTYPLVVDRAYTLSFEVKAEGGRGQFFAALCEGHRTGCQVGRSGAAGPQFARYALPFVSGSASTLTLELHSYSSEPGAGPTVYRRVSLVETPPEAFATPPVTAVDNELTHHDATPNSQFVTNPSPPDGFAPALNEINSYGIRGPELRPKAARRRVLLVGDSFVQADEVQFEDTFGEQLNRLLGDQVEFVAHGVSSWAPTTEFSWIHHKGMALRPDEVVLFICNNDFYPWATYPRSDEAYRAQAVWEEFVPVRYVGVEERRALDAPIRHRLGRSVRGIFSRIATAQLAYFGLRSLISAPLTDVETVVLFSADASTWPRSLRQSVDETIEVIARLGAYLDSRGVELTVAVVPSGLRWKDEVVSVKTTVPRWRQLVEASGRPAGEFSLSEAGLVRHLQERLASHNVEMVDLGPAFDEAKAGGRDLLFNGLDGHWNVKGHTVVATALAERFGS